MWFSGVYALFGQSQVIDSLKNLVSKTNEDTATVIILNKLSFQFLRITSYDSALRFGEKAFKIADRIDYTKGKAKSLINIGNVYLAKRDFGNARKYYEESLISSKRINDILVISHATNNLGELYREQEDYENALRFYIETLDWIEKLKDEKEKGDILNNIALVYEQLKEYEKANEYLRESIFLNIPSKDYYSVSTSYLNMADNFFKIDLIDSADVYYAKAILIKNSIHEMIGLGHALLGKGNIYNKKGNDQQALSLYQEALNLSREAEDRINMGLCLSNMGSIYSKTGRIQKAILCYREALSLAEAAHSKSDVQDYLHHLAIAYKETQDYSKALQYYMRYVSLHDSLMESHQQEQTRKILAKYEAEKKEKEIELLKTDQQLQIQINRNQQLLFIGSVVFLLSGLLMVFFRWQMVKQKNLRLAEKLDSQNRELATVAMLVAKKNNSLTEVKSKLTELSKNELENGPSVSSIIKDVEREVSFDEEWNSYKYHFEKVHPGFFSKLTNLCPALTNTDLRLCAYIKSSLTTKEIAELTHTTVRSVQQAKYRVNQKIEHSENTLNDFLRNL